MTIRQKQTLMDYKACKQGFH